MLHTLGQLEPQVKSQPQTPPHPTQETLLNPVIPPSREMALPATHVDPIPGLSFFALFCRVFVCLLVFQITFPHSPMGLEALKNRDFFVWHRFPTPGST